MNFPKLVKANIPHCQRCGDTENLMRHGVGSSGRIYYFCNPCNTSRCRKWRNEGKNMEVVLGIAKRYADKNQERVKAWRKVRESEIPKRPCQVCGAEKVHAHHPEPKKPLLIVHLCPLHHRQVHAGKIPCPKAFDFSLEKK